MVATTAETLVVNGVLLNTLAKNVESLTGRLRAPAHRTKNIALPGMHGELWVPHKKYQANTLALPMWVVGCDDDGGIPAGSSKRREFFKRVDELVSLFKSPELLEVIWTTARETPRRCWAEALDVLDFTTDASPRGLVGVVLTVPGAFWEDTEDRTQRFDGDLAQANPSEFAGGSAPIEDGVYRFRGPWTNPRATFSDGSWFRYNEAIPAGQTLIVNAGEWELAGEGGLVPDYSRVEHDGEDAYWLALPASAAAIQLAGEDRTQNSYFSITGKRKYLVG